MMFCWRGLVGRIADTEVLGVQGLLEPTNWPCVGAQVKDESHVVLWTVCKIPHNQNETSCRFGPHTRECLYSSGNISTLSI